MNIFPAIDVISGQAVRLTKGDYSTQKTYSDTPVKVAEDFYKLGARFLHVVDLDGAKTGRTENYSLISDIVKSTSMFVEVGGGVRDMERIEKYLSVGVKRIILGTSAVKNPQFRRDAVRVFGDAVAVGVDTLNGTIATDGWLKDSGVSGVEFCKMLRDEGVKNVIYTDISRDGTLAGTNLDVYRTLCGIEGLTITASGGVTFIEEIKELKAMGAYGAIVGKAIYEGKLDLKEVLKVAL